MNLQDELGYLRSVVTPDELKTYCKLKGILAFHEDNADNAMLYANEMNCLMPKAEALPSNNASDSKTIDADDVKQAMSKISDKDMSVDNVIGEISPSQINNQDLRNLVQKVISGK